MIWEIILSSKNFFWDFQNGFLMIYEISSQVWTVNFSKIRKFFAAQIMKNSK